MNDRGYPESWPEFARMLWRDRVRRRNAAIILLTVAGMAVLVIALLLGEVWVFTRLR
jgi:hypothetical protein